MDFQDTSGHDDVSTSSIISDPGYLKFLNVLQSNDSPEEKVSTRQGVHRQPQKQTAPFVKPSTDLGFRRSLDEEGKKELLLFYEAPSSHLQYILQYQPANSFGFVKNHVHDGLSDDEITLYDADESVRGVFRPNAARAKAVETSSSVVSQLSIQLSASSQESLPESLYDGPKVYIEGKVVPPSPSQGDDESFYVGPGEENFINNGSVQESDISESTDEIVSIEGSTSEVMDTKPSMLAAIGVASSVNKRIGDNDMVSKRITDGNPAAPSKALELPVLEKTTTLAQPKNTVTSSDSEGYNEFLRLLMAPTVAVSVTEDGTVTLSVSLKDQEIGSVTLAMKDEDTAKSVEHVAKSKDDDGFEDFMLFLQSPSPQTNKVLKTANEREVMAGTLTAGPVKVTEHGDESGSNIITKASHINSTSKVREVCIDGSNVEEVVPTTAVSQNTTTKKFVDASKEHSQPGPVPSSEPETEKNGLLKFLGAAAAGATGAVAAKVLSDDQKKEANKVIDDNELCLPVILQEPQVSDDSNGLVTAAAIGGVIAVAATNEKSTDTEKSIESVESGYDDFLLMLQLPSSPKTTKELNVEKVNSVPTNMKKEAAVDNSLVSKPTEEAKPVQACDASLSNIINETAINEVVTKSSSPEITQLVDAKGGTLDTLNELPAVLESTGDDLASVVETVVSEETTPKNRLFFSRKKATKAARESAQSQPVSSSEQETEKKGIFTLIGAAAAGAGGAVAAKFLGSDHEKGQDIEVIVEGDKSISHVIKEESEVNDDHFNLVTAAVVGGVAVSEAADSPRTDDIAIVKSSTHVDKGLDDSLSCNQSPNSVEINDLVVEKAESLSNIVKEETVEVIVKSEPEEACDVSRSSKLINAAPIKGAATRSSTSETEEVKTKWDTQERLDEQPARKKAVVEYTKGEPVGGPALSEPGPKTEENDAFKLVSAVAAGAVAMLLGPNGDEKGDGEVVSQENKSLGTVTKEGSEKIVHPSNLASCAAIGTAATTKCAFSDDKVKEDTEVIEQRNKSLSTVTKELPEINTEHSRLSAAAIGGVLARSSSPEISEDISIKTASSPVEPGEESNRSNMTSPFSDISGIYFIGAELGEEDVTTRTCISNMYFSGAEFNENDIVEFTSPKPKGGAEIVSNVTEASVNREESFEDLPGQSVQSLSKVKSLEELVVQEETLSPFAIAGKITVNEDFLQSISSVGSGSFDEFFDCLSQVSHSSIQILDKTPPELGLANIAVQSGSPVVSLEDFYSCMSGMSFKSVGTGSDSELSREKSADYIIRTFLLSLVFHLCQFKAESGVAEICIWGHLYLRFIRRLSVDEKTNSPLA